jgi:MerR family copper efflux transcriptional regulator
MRIGLLADRCGLTTQTIRYYESIDLLDPPARTESGYREYGPDAVERLRFIRDAQATGLTLEEIQTLLGMKDANVSTCGHTLAFLDRHVAEIDEQIARLQSARADLVRLADRGRRLDPAECTDPNRCHVIERRS